IWVTPLFGSMLIAFGVAGGLCGLKVETRPPPDPAVHWVADAQASENNGLKNSLSSSTGVCSDGVCGLNVTSEPFWSTAVHWVATRHAILNMLPFFSTVAGVAVADEIGSNVTAWVSLIAVHSVADEHATAEKFAPRLICLGVPGVCGLNTIARLLPSGVTHSVADGHARPPIPLSGLVTVSIVTGEGAPGEPGSKVNSWPNTSTTVH